MLRKVTTTDNEDLTFDLAPCPHCGKDIAMFSDCQELQCCESFSRCPSVSCHLVICSYLYGGCGSSSGFHQTYEEAAEAWNRRS